MTREELERMFAYQAADAAYKYAGERCHKNRPISASKLETFEAGAEWAQKIMIDRAVEWIMDNWREYIFQDADGMIGFIGWEGDFRKAMEE